MLKKKKVRGVSKKFNTKLYSYVSNELLTTAGEFETDFVTKINFATCVLLSWKRKH